MNCAFEDDKRLAGRGREKPLQTGGRSCAKRPVERLAGVGGEHGPGGKTRVGVGGAAAGPTHGRDEPSQSRL